LEDYDEICLRFRLALELICEPDPSIFGSHSMRRGGVKFLLAQGYQLDYVAELGDWGLQSLAFLRYIVNFVNKTSREDGKEVSGKVR
jgi:hypothetical protein